MGTEYGDARRKCEQLSLRESDAMFFPGRGGKPFQARNFCTDCPFIAKCLTEAIELKLIGFFAGTTEDERTAMRPYHFMRSLMDFMPPEPDRNERPVYLKVIVTEDPRAWMDVADPTPEELAATAMLQAV